MAASPKYASEVGSGPGPDFICIGHAKAGTSWLYDQMRAHPGVWMPPIKEINFLVGNAMNMANRRTLGRLSKYSDPRDIAFLERFTTYPGPALDFDWYRRLFLPKQDDVSGDISPTYSALSADSVASIAPNLAGVKIVLLVRDPVELAWSALCQLQRANRVPAWVFDNWHFVRLLLLRAKNRQKLYPSRVWRAWEPHFSNRMAFWFLDDISTSPQQVLDQISAFVGAPAGQGAIDPFDNPKANDSRMTLTPHMRGHLRAHFRDEIARCASLFGGAAKAWLDR